jgi:ABC-type uncharacterized transport system substrate-binding protein
MSTVTTYKRMKSLPGLLLFVLLLSLQGFAQTVSTKESLEAMKVSFITQKINLTPEEAQVFWPIYNQYETELDALRKKRKDDKATVTDDEKLVDGEIIFRQQELDIIKKYHAQFKKILPIKKVALLYKAQEDYKKELLKQIQEKARNK